MGEHIGPFVLQFPQEGRCLDSLARKYLHALRFALLLVHGPKESSLRKNRCPSVQEDYVVEVTRPGSLSHSPQLLGESLLKAVASHLSGHRQGVGVLVGDGAQDSGTHHVFRSSQVEPEACDARRVPWATVVDTPLG